MKKIFLVAGEVSGDRIAGWYIKRTSPRQVLRQAVVFIRSAATLLAIAVTTALRSLTCSLRPLQVTRFTTHDVRARRSLTLVALVLFR